MKIFDTVVELNQRENLISNGDKIVVGFSGGPDSVFLCEALLKLKEDINFEMVLVHINHLLRGDDADADEKFSSEYAKKKNIKFFSRRIDIKKIAADKKKTLEEVGREERYKFFNEILDLLGANKIATAHNKDDQIETFLFKLIRGTSLIGLEGIKPKSLNLIRPISEVYKKDILKYLNKNKIQYKIDKTNFENDFTRNSIRLDLIPFIEKRYNIKFKNKVFNVIQEIRENNLENKINLSEYISNDRLELKLLNDLSNFKKKNVMVDYLHTRGIEISKNKLDLLLNFLNTQGQKKLDLGKNNILVKEYDTLYLSRKEEIKRIETVKLKIPGEVRFGNFVFTAKKISSEFESTLNNDNSMLLNLNSGDELLIRQKKDGDRIKINGVEKGKKLKEIFINEKIPKDKRATIPIVEYKNEIIWAVGVKKAKLSNVFFKTTEKILFSAKEVKIER